MAEASPSPPPPPPPPNGGQADQEGLNEEHVMEREVNNLVLPEDGYEWRKYGQKFIRNIGKTRSYFKCRRPGCSAKKKAEWTNLDINNVQICYEGIHTHGAPESNSSGTGASSSAVNEYYNLYDQMLRNQNNNTS